mmetsp:Transcript_27932/g.44287  ORF Transcript_27932/g.44287 Transcript_27932/m.44287 type:complete len:270 (-) Transcript_27932:658-1467(-)
MAQHVAVNPPRVHIPFSVAAIVAFHHVLQVPVPVAREIVRILLFVAVQRKLHHQRCHSLVAVIQALLLLHLLDHPLRVARTKAAMYFEQQPILPIRFTPLQLEIDEKQRISAPQQSDDFLRVMNVDAMMEALNAVRMRLARVKQMRFCCRIFPKTFLPIIGQFRSFGQKPRFHRHHSADCRFAPTVLEPNDGRVVHIRFDVDAEQQALVIEHKGELPLFGVEVEREDIAAVVQRDAGRGGHALDGPSAWFGCAAPVYPPTVVLEQLQRV